MSAISVHVVRWSASPPLAPKLTAAIAIATPQVRAAGALTCIRSRTRGRGPTRGLTLSASEDTSADGRERSGGCTEAEQDEHDEDGCGEPVAHGGGTETGGARDQALLADRLGFVLEARVVERLGLARVGGGEGRAAGVGLHAARRVGRVAA